MQYGEALRQGKALCEKTSTSLSSAFTHPGGPQVAVEYAIVVKVSQTGGNLSDKPPDHILWKAAILYQDVVKGTCTSVSEGVGNNML